GDGTATLHGPHIQAFTEDELVKVLGGGTLEALREADPGEPPRPIAAEWTEGVVVDGKANRIDVTGDVVVTTSEADGTSHAIVSEALRMGLVDAPKAGAEATTKEQEEAEKPADEKAAQFLGSKVVRDVVFERSVEVRS